MSEEQKEDGFVAEFLRVFQEFEAACAENNMPRASVAMNAVWVMFQIMATSQQTELQELTYLKTPFVFDNGGRYMLTFTHVDGPKIKLRESSGTGYTKPFEEIK